MKITVIGRKCTPRDSFKERAEKRLRKVEKFFPDEVEAKVTAIVEKSEQIVEVTIFHDGMIFRSQERAINMNDALDRCVDSLVRQMVLKREWGRVFLTDLGIDVSNQVLAHFLF